MKRIKKYQIQIDENDEISGIDLISFVKDPAILIKGFAFAEQKEFKFITQDDKMIVVGPALIPDVEIYRRDEEGEFYVTFSKETIIQLVKKFNSQLKESVFNIDHSTKLAPAYVLESWLVEHTEYDKSRFYGFENIPVGSWFISAQVTDKEFWDKEIKANGKFGFSIEGFLGLVESKLSKVEVKKNIKTKSGEVIEFETTLNLGVDVQLNDGQYELENDLFALVFNNKLVELNENKLTPYQIYLKKNKVSK